MHQEDFLLLSKDLQSLAKTIPLTWGKIQNDEMDSQVNMFQIHSFAALEKEIAGKSDDVKNYFRRRWFLWKAAQCDEHLFCMNDNVMPNPNSRDQDYDIEFNRQVDLRFDIKGTVVPRKFRDNIEAVINDPTEMVLFFYDAQSTGVRSHIQNRLFLIHHSYRAQEREMYLRCHWDFKKDVYKEYAEKITDESQFINCKEVKADVIFLFENLDKTFSYRFVAIK